MPLQVALGVAERHLCAYTFSKEGNAIMGLINQVTFTRTALSFVRCWSQAAMQSKREAEQQNQRH